tara:strand:- start:311 stop:562 length:252 start_codon:yes stop_codon:yes gene_type:complete
MRGPFERARFTAERIASAVEKSSDGLPVADGVMAGIFLGMALWAEDEEIATQMRAWSIASGTGDYGPMARAITRNESVGDSPL